MRPFWLRHGGWIEAVALALAAPFLLFPTVLPWATGGALSLLAAVWTADIALVARPWPLSPLNGALLLWEMGVLVGVLVTADPELTLPKAAGLILGLALLRALSSLVSSTRVALRRALLGLGCLGLLFALVGVFTVDWPIKVPLVAGVIERMPSAVMRLPEGPSGGVSANQLGGTLSFFLPLLLSGLLAWLHDRGRHVSLIGGLLAAAGVLGLLILTQSRSAWLGAMAGLMSVLVFWSLWLPSSRLRSAVRIALGLVLVALLAGFWVVGPQGLLEIWQNPEGMTVVGELDTLDFRKEVWRWALAAIRDFPFTGCGLGTFRRVVRRFYPLAVRPDYDIAHAHNIFVQVALDTGLPGLMAYLAMLGIATLTAWHGVQRDPRLLPIAAGLLGGLVALHAFGMTDALAPGSKPAVIFWVALGICAGLADQRAPLRRSS